MNSAIKSRIQVTFKSYIFILVALLISVLFFLRGQWFGLTINFSLLIVLFSIILFLSLVFIYCLKGVILLPPLDVQLLAFFFIVNPLFSILIYQKSLVPSLLLIFELLLNLIIYYVFFIIISNGYISLDKILSIIVSISTIISISMINDVGQLESFRRYDFFGTAVNFLAHSISISSFIIFFWMYKSRSIKKALFMIMLLSINIIALVLTGSRSGLIAFIFATFLLILLTIFRSSAKKVFILISLVFISSAIMINFFNSGNSFQMLFSRFTLNSEFLSESGRIDLWIQSLSNVNTSNLLIGSPWLYEVYNVNSIHPHNFFISMLVYTGLTSLILMLLFLFRSIISILTINKITYINKIFIMLIILIPIIYASVSGNFTRIYSIFLILGIIDGLISLNRNKFLNKGINV